MERFQVDAVLRDTFSLFAGNLRLLAGTALAVQIPSLAVTALGTVVETGDFGRPGVSHVLLSLVETLLWWVLGSLSMAAVTWAAAKVRAGEPVRIGDAVRVGLPLVPLVIGVNLIAGLLTMLGMLAFVVPGVIVALMFWVAVPVLVVERAGVLEALGRSRELTAGRRLRLFGLGLLYLLVVAIPAGLIFTVLGLGMAAGMAPAAAATVALVAAALSVVLGALGATLQLTAYHALRRERGGVETASPQIHSQ